MKTTRKRRSTAPALVTLWGSLLVIFALVAYKVYDYAVTHDNIPAGGVVDIADAAALADAEELPAGDAAQAPDPTLEKIVVLPPPIPCVDEKKHTIETSDSPVEGGDHAQRLSLIAEETDEEALITIQYSAHNIAKIREIQRLLGIEVDGRVGKATLDAMILKLGGKIPAKPAKAAKVTLRKLPTAREVRSNRSIYGKAGLVPMAIVTLPYPMKYGEKTIHQIGVHYLIADRVELAFKRTLAHYGYERIKELNLDVYNGCFNYRRVRRGSLMSMHAWAVALDFDAANNGLGVPTSRAAFARPEYKGWRDAWESVGAVFYGKQRGHDWMQIQFVR